MKFCYLDESGTGDEPIAVMLGVIVDSYRMRRTKNEWEKLLLGLSDKAKKPMQELHTRDFYRGNGIWRGVPGKERAEIIGEIFSWIKDRGHKIVYSVVDKDLFSDNFKNEELSSDINSLWQFMGMHICLQLQKFHQNEKKNKGNTVLVFDEEVREEARFLSAVKSPPEWTDSFYKKGKKQERLDQIVDVPYFCDSRDVSLVQLADFLCYFVRLYVEMSEGKTAEGYDGEKEKIASWVEPILALLISKSHIYPKIKKCPCSTMYRSYAPDCVL
ncbi:hypothetical protein PSDVSF_13450 [Pseudodesulfovibrio sediminis]|uniref:DUF3800 domain-containing protein n=2 Tax=Pseudodesulfovibrio sediminis TaxID=2810563 RepID=A0ABM7P5D3_9BACT|nr:hypothetical protein PSDVSF_13450 [Pseudodesulfovibrio sediminis]